MALLLNANDTVSRSYSYTIPSPNHLSEVQAVGDRTANVFPAGEKKTVVSNGITFDSDGSGRYHISGTASAHSSVSFNLVSGFTAPISVSNGGQGTLSFFNTQPNSSVAFAFYNGTTKVDDWTMVSINRTSVAYMTMGNKYVDKVIIIVNSGATVDITIMPEFTNDGVLPSGFEPYGYKIPVVTRGNNLIDVANLTGKTDALFTNNINPKLAQVKFDEATQYTISMKFEIDTRLGWRKITFTYTDGTTSVSPWIATSGLFKYTSTSGKTIAKVEFTNYNYYGDVYVEYIQLESGTEATEYSPYIEPITTPIYLPTPLYSGEVMRSDGTITRSDGTTETFTAPQIPTLNGTTVIDVDTAVKPTEMHTKYKSSK